MDPLPPDRIDRQCPGSAQPAPVIDSGNALQDPVRDRRYWRLPALPGARDALPSARRRTPVRLRAAANPAADGAPVLSAVAVLRSRLAELSVAFSARLADLNRSRSRGPPDA